MNTIDFPEAYHDYIEKLPKGKLIPLMELSLKELIGSLAMVSEDQSNLAYEPGKWSIKDVLQHLIDTERIFCFRALSFARGDQNEIKGYDHDAYANEAIANERSLKSLLEEMKQLRLTSIQLFNSFSPEIMQRNGTANGNQLTVNQIGYIILGHLYHHLYILDTKYLK
tara:strand:+ start:305 stop:808 length:504 start_codon:yes stop_codon:yes gene_type:complete